MTVEESIEQTSYSQQTLVIIALNLLYTLLYIKINSKQQQWH